MTVSRFGDFHSDDLEETGDNARAGAELQWLSSCGCGAQFANTRETTGS